MVSHPTVIPLIDLGGKTPVDLLREHADSAHALIGAATNTLGFASRWASKVVLPPADRRSRAWLKRTNNPYLPEIDAMVEALDAPGIYALNLSYEWGCTSGAFKTGESVAMLRLLDWPFPDIGKLVMVIRRSSAAGEFYNVGWPGMSGMLNGMAPARFSAALNQAPMRRHGLIRAGDWFKNRQLVDQADGLPPTHLLRKAFEEAPNYAAALEMLTRTPVALPVIYILAGTRQGEGCVIERLENSSRVLHLAGTDRVTTANHFNSELNLLGRGWRARSQNSPERYLLSCSMPADGLRQNNFDWVQAPMLNHLTRLGVIADALTGRLIVQGMEGESRVTELFNLQELQGA